MTSPRGEVVALVSELIESEDIISLVSDPYMVGEVIQVGCEDPDIDDEDLGGTLEEDELIVCWLGDGENTIENVKDIQIADKTFISGNLVARKESRDQSGVITEIKVLLDLQFLDGTFLTKVPSELLHRLFPLEECDYVTKGNNMGTISSTNDFLKVKFGEREFWMQDDDYFERHETKYYSFKNCPTCYFPGQKVMVEVDGSELFVNYDPNPELRKRAKQKILDKLNPLAVVTDIKVDTVEVDWFLIQDTTISEKDQILSPNEVEMVNDISFHKKLSIGSRCRFKDKTAEKEAKKKNVDKNRPKAPLSTNPKSKQAKKRKEYQKYLDSIHQCCLVVGINTSYSVDWQDGSVSENVPSTTLVGYDPSGVNEFWPQSIVCRTNEMNSRGTDFSTWGVVLSTNLSEQMVTVKWIAEENTKFFSDPKEEIISLFSLIAHPSYNQVIPDKLVVRPSKINEEPLPFRESIGKVLSAKDGKCSVCWLSGNISDVFISELTFLDDEILNDDDEYSDSDDDDDWPPESKLASVIQCIENLVEKILPGHSGSTEEESEEEEVEVDEEEVEVENSAPECSGSSYPHLSEFSRFDSLSEPPVNHYFLTTSSTIPPRGSRAIFKEWKSLQRNLPEGIFVRSFESHMDLLQAMIIGPKNTPYSDSLFLFDIRFPSDYPSSPPKFHFHSITGKQINPNLYPNGNICLSLLGTWNGEGVEVWNPFSSSLLQVLLSIQGLILGIEEPYFLEADFEKRKGSSVGCVQSLRYNPTAILGSLWHTLCTYQASQSESFISHFNDIIITHVEYSLPITKESIRKYLAFAAGHKDATTEELYPFFGVPMEASEGFHQQLTKFLTTEI